MLGTEPEGYMLTVLPTKSVQAESELCLSQQLRNDLELYHFARWKLKRQLEQEQETRGHECCIT